MNRTQIIGTLFLVSGIGLYFFVDHKSYSTIAGFITGLGIAIILIGAAISARLKK